MSIPQWLQRALDHYGVPFQVRRHRAAYSASHLAQAVHVSGYRVAKTVFLSARGRPVGVIVPACALLDLTRVHEVLGDHEARLASEEEIGAWFKGCKPGTVPPLRLRDDECLLMDRSLAHLGGLVFPAGNHENSISVRFRDWYGMVRPGVGRFILRPNGRHHQPTSPQVLVVEDETDTNALLCRLLEQEGFTCRGVEEGTLAVALASESPPSVIVLDLMLPDMSGFEMCQRLRREGPMKRALVIVVTAIDDEATRRRGWELGADAFLTKPFQPQALMYELHGALADAQA